MKAVFLTLMCLMLSFSESFAQALPDEGESGLTLPRFASLRSDHINARSGPGSRYPIEWVYMQKMAPVEIRAEFELWRKIKDWQGSESWVHKSMLSGKRSVKVVSPGENNIYNKADYKSKIIAKVEDEVVGEVMKCPAEKAFCLIKFGSIEGWVPKGNLFGVYADEVID